MEYLVDTGDSLQIRISMKSLPMPAGLAFWDSIGYSEAFFFAAAAKLGFV